MGAQDQQPGLFDLIEPEPEAPSLNPQPPLEGTTSWRRVSRRLDCADCSAEQAADYAAGRSVHFRQRADLLMVAGSEQVPLCTHHAMDRGWSGRTGTRHHTTHAPK